MRAFTPTILIITLLAAGVAWAAGGGTDYSARVPSDRHFDPKGKPPSEHTLKAIVADSAGLPFEDTRDFDEAKKGFIAEPESWKVVGPAGNVVWDLGRYDFFRTDQDFPSVHPSLQRVSRLNMKVGLFEVKPGFYQVRGFDLANITFVKGETGWIVFDPLTAPEAAAAAKKLVDQHLGERPVTGVVYSHSHVDHWGGVRGIVDEADVRHEPARHVPVRRAAAVQPVRPRRPGPEHERGQRQYRADPADPRDREGHRDRHRGRREDGVHEHARW
jgi:hypothetical protein